ncbi:tyrosine-type recombinase/integrase [Microbacterium lacticum]|uniref:tyrosine-type recombinase/integrase n=1 Tax=Microbacterium lacticum TaxID=33885 RepID=UPI003A866617
MATLAACSAHPTLVLTLAYTGLRWGEVTALRVRSVNRLRRRFVVEENAVMIGYEIHVGTPKTHKSRSVPYPERLTPLVEEACAGKGPEGLLFGDGINHMRNSGAQGWFANAVKRAQAVDPSIPRLTPHDLRHTAASLAISSGANVKAVQRMLGHASAARRSTRTPISSTTIWTPSRRASTTPCHWWRCRRVHRLGTGG